MGTGVNIHTQYNVHVVFEKENQVWARQLFKIEHISDIHMHGISVTILLEWKKEVKN